MQDGRRRTEAMPRRLLLPRPRHRRADRMRARREDVRQLVDQPRAVVVEELEPERLLRDALVHDVRVVRRAVDVLPARDVELVVVAQVRAGGHSWYGLVNRGQLTWVLLIKLHGDLLKWESFALKLFKSRYQICSKSINENVQNVHYRNSRLYL